MGTLDLMRWRNFGLLHTRARQGELDSQRFAAYLDERNDLERALLESQRSGLKPEQSSREYLRIVHGLQVNLEFQNRALRTPTLDVSRGGFAVLLTFLPGIDEKVKACIEMPGNQRLIMHARVANVRHLPTIDRFRVGFRSDAMKDSDVERLSMFIFDRVVKVLEDFVV